MNYSLVKCGAGKQNDTLSRYGTAPLHRDRRPALSVARPVALRRAHATPAEQQPTLFTLRKDHRPASELNAAERYREPSLFTVLDSGNR
jgi:hypothetical protein